MVANIVEEYKFLSNWYEITFQGWHLPAVSEPHDWCGMWKTIGCLNDSLHEKLGRGKFYYIKQFQRSCYRARCKTCYLKWIARQANNATTRINTYSQKRKNKTPIHLILSVPPSQHGTPVKILRQRMSHILRLGQIEGGAVIFHPFRLNHSTRQWYPYPHFHLVGFGNKSDIRNAFGRYGWYVKEAGERSSTFQTLCYLLSHCGIQKGYKSVTWFGNLSYSNLQVEKEPRINRCPICEGEFVEVYYENEYHPVVPPDKHYEGLVEAEGWHPVKAILMKGVYEFESNYHPITHLNEIIKGITE
ncbi:MAG: hypothetical protein DWQ13_07190 [Crenarchaeota archaeon]|nr:MAG: hypothetical protein DWQ13_07190 [Thermoproteota archaeon]